MSNNPHRSLQFLKNKKLKVKWRELHNIQSTKIIPAHIENIQKQDARKKYYDALASSSIDSSHKDSMREIMSKFASNCC